MSIYIYAVCLYVIHLNKVASAHSFKLTSSLPFCLLSTPQIQNQQTHKYIYIYKSGKRQKNQKKFSCLTNFFYIKKYTPVNARLEKTFYVSDVLKNFKVLNLLS